MTFTGTKRPKKNKKVNRRSILLMHGTFMDASSWFYPETRYSGQPFNDYVDRPLPIRLWELGFDVWLGNMRGTQYARGHETLDSSDPQSDYWK